MRVESICIVGGGSAGWMSAALLSHEHPDLEIALIESDNIKPIGVGESTLQHFNRFLKRLELKDEDWMPSCNATYKASIRFKNFRDGKGEAFQYPFGDMDREGDMDRMDTWIMRFFELQCMYGKDKYPPEEFAQFINRQTYLADAGIMTREMPGILDREESNWDLDNDTSYHLNADKFGEYLRDNIAVPNGVHHIKGDVHNIIKTPEGYIKSVITLDGGCISADLFIDCTGFRSLLLETHMGVDFVPFNDMLFNDSALVTHIDYKDKETEMVPYTDCVALSNGWVYNIPMWNNIGTGYVYSSKYINQCEAELEFREYLNDQDCPLMPIKIKHGRHDVAWTKNVVGIGLAYGFLEPLESTGLMTTHENLILLSDTLSQRDRIVTKHDRDVFNHQTEKIIESMKNFVTLHYTLSCRDDTQYWRDCTETINFGKFEHGINEATLIGLNDYRNLLDSLEMKTWESDNMGEGTIYITAGMGVRPISEAFFKEKRSHEEGALQAVRDAHKAYQTDKEIMLDWVSKQPSHYEYLKEHIYV